MQIHELKPKKRDRKKKRIGRGGKRGTYSGKGQKGQSSRAGAKKPRTAQNAVKKFPKLRGVKNKAFRPKPAIISIRDLQKSGITAVTKDALFEGGLIKSKKKQVKILSDGEIKNIVSIGGGIKLSKKAKEKIEGAGGRTMSK